MTREESRVNEIFSKKDFMPDKREAGDKGQAEKCSFFLGPQIGEAFRGS